MVCVIYDVTSLLTGNLIALCSIICIVVSQRLFQMSDCDKKYLAGECHCEACKTFPFCH